MTMQSSGPISLSDIQTTFGGSAPTSLSEYYSGGLLVPFGTTGLSGLIPNSGTISISQFYGSPVIIQVRYVNATQSIVNGEPVLIFHGNGSIVTPSAINVRRLVVGGGGKGGDAGNDRSGGGGGGAVIDNFSAVSAGTYQIVVGSGSASAIVGYDKYGGAIYSVNSATASSFSSVDIANFGSDGTNGQGNYGWGASGGASGNGNSGGPNGGGGGGAGVAAVNANGTGVSLGGQGRQSDITGTVIYYGGGGGGGAATSDGGLGGGGNAGAYGAIPQNGTDYLGGGGGGSSGYHAGGSGGKGVVILRLPSNIAPIFGGATIDIPDNAGGTGEGFYRTVAEWKNDTGATQNVYVTGTVASNNTKTLDVRAKVNSGPYIALGTSGNGKSGGAKVVSLSMTINVPNGSILYFEAYLWGAYNSDKVSPTSIYLTV
jgi:hypothetical protein